MPSNNRSAKNKLAAVSLLLVGGVVVVFVATYVRSHPESSRVPIEVRRAEPRPAPITSRKQSSQSQTKVFIPRVAAGNDIRLDSKTVDVPRNQDPLFTAVSGFLKESKIVPAGARLQAARIEDGIAYLDFNKEFEQTYGSMDEKALIDGLRAAAGQFEGVEKVMVWVEGRPLETLGNVDLTQGLIALRNGKDVAPTHVSKPPPTG